AGAMGEAPSRRRVKRSASTTCLPGAPCKADARLEHLPATALRSPHPWRLARVGVVRSGPNTRRRRRASGHRLLVKDGAVDLGRHDRARRIAADHDLSIRGLANAWP